MLAGYISSLEAYYKRSEMNSANEGKPRRSTDKWTQATASAHRAQGFLRGAEKERQMLHIDVANSHVRRGMEALRERCSSSAFTRIASD